MPGPDAPTAELATLAPPLALAVVTVLTRAGVPAAVSPARGRDAVVLVPAARREEALGVLAARMDDVHAEAEAAAEPTATTGLEAPPAGPGAHPGGAPDDDGGTGRPLFLERVRSLGWIAVALVPLLVIALARVRLPGAVVTALLIATIVLLSAWRSGRLGRED